MPRYSSLPEPVETASGRVPLALEAVDLLRPGRHPDLGHGLDGHQPLPRRAVGWKLPPDPRGRTEGLERWFFWLRAHVKRGERDDIARALG